MPNAQWHEEVLPRGWSDAAAELARTGVLTDFYLAGGTGLALQLGHRVSVDLDLFTQRHFEARAVRDALRLAGGFRVDQLAEGTLHAEVGGVQLTFLRYDYPLLFEVTRFKELTVASPRDIACMKLEALSSRGSRRDFVDLYFVLQRFPLRDLLGWFERKYASAAPNQVHLAKALTYFVDAEQEPMPRMLQPADWKQIREFFESLARQHFRV